ncbi:flavodoxin domain-containing protein [Streptomyces sp. SID5643]|uniref:flavodoxin domain-containing protein n=1 Tax=Streptomyces sp. SID5643 TaxID=2690307 RepID=UPI00136ACD76|nr:hypothetical protein [Streptomyces sp. SID5643]
MKEKVLVVYGSTNGSTAEIADHVGEVLAEEGLAVDVRPASDVTDPASYGAVVLGGGLYGGRWHRDTRRFARRHRKTLAERPVWLFSSGPLDPSASERDIPPAPGVRRVNAPRDGRCIERSGATRHAHRAHHAWHDVLVRCCCTASLRPHSRGHARCTGTPARRGRRQRLRHLGHAALHQRKRRGTQAPRAAAEHSGADGRPIPGPARPSARRHGWPRATRPVGPLPPAHSGRGNGTRVPSSPRLMPVRRIGPTS